MHMPAVTLWAGVTYWFLDGQPSFGYSCALRIIPFGLLFVLAIFEASRSKYFSYFDLMEVCTVALSLNAFTLLDANIWGTTCLGWGLNTSAVLHSRAQSHQTFHSSQGYRCNL